ncbi:hypothetical protein AAGT10_06590 [Sulfolobus tengchongensis]
MIICSFIILFITNELLLQLLAIYLILILASLLAIYLPLFLYGKLIFSKIFNEETIAFSPFKVPHDLINNDISKYKLYIRNYVIKRKQGILILGFLVIIIQSIIFLIPYLIGNNIMTESNYYFVLVIIITIMYPALYFIALFIRKLYIYIFYIIYKLFKSYNESNSDRFKKFLAISSSLLLIIIGFLLYITIRYLYTIILEYSKQFIASFMHLIYLPPWAPLSLFLIFILFLFPILWFLIDISDIKKILIIHRNIILEQRKS